MPDLHFREIELRAVSADGDLIPCVLTTEAAVGRDGFDEVLSCDPRDVDLSRAPLPLIVQHDRSNLNIGVIEQITAGDGKLRGVARFGTSAVAREILADVKAGIVRSLSVGYLLIKRLSRSGRTERYAWAPFECSVVSVPADPGAGFYRSVKGTEMPEITVDDDATRQHHTRSQRRTAARGSEDERHRASQIAAMGNQHNLQALAQRAIEAGTSVDDFRVEVLRNVRAAPIFRVDENPDIGLTQREAESYSFVKAINAQLDPNYARREAGFELAASRALAETLGREPQGLYVPNEVLRLSQTGRRDLVTGTAGDGGYLVGTVLAADSFIEMLRKQTHLFNLGATPLGGLVGNLAIPSQIGAAQAFWVAEGGAPTETQQTFGQVPLSPKTVGAFTDYTRRMLLQSTPDIEMIVRRDLAAILGVELDRVGFNGSGTGNQPLGVLNTSGIASVPVDTNGGPITWDHILMLEEALANANADMGALAYVTNNKVRRKLKGTLKVSGDAGAGFIWNDDRRDDSGYGSMNGYRSAASNNIPSDLVKGSGTGLSAAIFGNWSDVLVGQWGGLDILVDKFTHGTSGGTRVIALLDVDVAIRRTASFAAIKDASTA